jgi:murein DD-endopeptidase MepM/ murein hydrolase activator NlpD
MSDKRKPFPQFNPFRDFVIDELRRRKRIDVPTPTAAPFVRFTSCMEDPALDYAFFSLGLHGFDNADGANIFDLTYGTRKEVVGYAYHRSKDPNTGIHKKRLIFADDISPNVESFRSFITPTFTEDDAERATQERKAEQLSKIPNAAHPIPGITGVSITRRGLGQPLIATVNWQCYNQGQLEFLRNHFLSTGNYVIIEIGNQFSDKQVKNVLPFRQGHSAVWNNLLQTIGAVGSPNQLLQQRGREFVIEAFNKPNGGNYDFIVGSVSNFQINIEPETGIYKCTTKIVSQGENIWGLTIGKTFVDQVTPENHGITTIRDYFEEGSYQLFLESLLAANKSGIVKTEGTAFQKDAKATKPKEQDKVNQNPSDFMFVTWEFLTRDLLDDMLSTIKTSAIKEEIKHFAQLKTVLEEDYVGYHPLLKSAEPESLLIINKTMSGIATAQKFSSAGSGYFQPKSAVAGDRAGKINEGIWINTGMIREAFMTSNDLRQAFSFILSRMNRSTGGYWDLRLFWDDERATYRVIDYKYGTQHRGERFYKFNVGGAGECLGIEFDSAFPPELVTQMNLVSMFQTLSPEKQAEYTKTYPLIGSTSAHMFMLNWTHLKDGLRDKINQWRDKNYSNSQLAAAPIVDRQNLATQNRVTQGYQTGVIPSTQGKENRPVAEKVGSNLPTTNTPDNTSITPRRNSVSGTELLSLTSSQERKLASRIQPTQGRISSKFDPSRKNPVTGEKRAHKGIDIAALAGTPVVAAMDGTIIQTGFDSGGWGRYITIDHGDGLKTLYAHLDSILVSSGRVSKGQTIGTVGSTGASTGPHLHYEIYINGKQVNPQDPTQTLSTQSSTSTTSPGPGDSGLIASSPMPAPIKPPSQVTEAERQARRDELKLKAKQVRRSEVTEKFGDAINDIIADHLGDMVNNITKDGYITTRTPNQFVSPFPTTTSVSVEIQGIAGISIGDGFFVDKIPFMFQKHGVFQVTETVDSVTERGWRTTIKGYFKMLWYDGKGESEIIV